MMVYNTPYFLEWNQFCPTFNTPPFSAVVYPLGLSLLLQKTDENSWRLTISHRPSKQHFHWPFPNLLLTNFFFSCLPLGGVFDTQTAFIISPQNATRFCTFNETSYFSWEQRVFSSKAWGGMEGITSTFRDSSPESEWKANLFWLCRPHVFQLLRKRAYIQKKNKLHRHSLPSFHY